MQEAAKEPEPEPSRRCAPFLLRNWKKAFPGAKGVYDSYFFCHNLRPLGDLPGCLDCGPKAGLARLRVKELRCVLCKREFVSSACLLLHYICTHRENSFYHKASIHSLSCVLIGRV